VAVTRAFNVTKLTATGDQVTTKLNLSQVKVVTDGNPATVSLAKVTDAGEYQVEEVIFPAASTFNSDELLIIRGGSSNYCFYRDDGGNTTAIEDYITNEVTNAVSVVMDPLVGTETAIQVAALYKTAIEGASAPVTIAINGARLSITQNAVAAYSVASFNAGPTAVGGGYGGATITVNVIVAGRSLATRAFRTYSLASGEIIDTSPIKTKGTLYLTLTGTADVYLYSL
jgi:hypothetical protein